MMQQMVLQKHLLRALPVESLKGPDYVYSLRLSLFVFNKPLLHSQCHSLGVLGEHEFGA